MDNINFSQQRIEYIDTLKGFLILSVVMCHVAGFCIGIQDDILSYQQILFEFRNPPFFFVSGFFAYKVGTIWNGKYAKSVITKKLRLLVWPTILFLSILLYIHPSFNGRTFLHDSIQDLWFHWFTFALFLFFIFYAVLEHVLYKTKFSSKTEDIVLLTFGILCYIFFSVQSVYDWIPLTSEMKNILGMPYWGFFLFFTLGCIAKKHYSLFIKLLENMYFIGMCILVFVLFNIFSQPLMDFHFNLFRIVTYLTGIILVFTFFKVTTLPKLLKNFFVFTGKRTLDIYLIHYFFLPLALYQHTSFFRETPMPVLELIVTTSISVAIIILSLLLSRIIRLSNISTLFFFGEKKMPL